MEELRVLLDRNKTQESEEGSIQKKEEQINKILKEEEDIKRSLAQPLFLLGSRYNPFAPHVRGQLRDIDEKYLSRYSSLSNDEKQNLKSLLESFDVTLIMRPYEVLQLYIMMGSNYERIDKPLAIFPHLEKNRKDLENLKLSNSSKKIEYEYP